MAQNDFPATLFPRLKKEEPRRNQKEIKAKSTDKIWFTCSYSINCDQYVVFAVDLAASGIDRDWCQENLTAGELKKVAIKNTPENCLDRNFISPGMYSFKSTFSQAELSISVLSNETFIRLYDPMHYPSSDNQMNLVLRDQLSSAPSIAPKKVWLQLVVLSCFHGYSTRWRLWKTKRCALIFSLHICL